MTDAIFLKTTGIRKRMQCSGNVASIIENQFVTVQQLLDAIESDEPLTERKGVGPATAETIEEWYENRHEIEENMPSSTTTKSSMNSATVFLHSSWEPAFEDDG